MEDQTPLKLQTKYLVLQEMVERRLRDNPNSRLAPFRNNIPLLADKVWEHWNEPEVQDACLRITTLNGLFGKFVRVGRSDVDGRPVVPAGPRPTSLKSSSSTEILN